MARSKAELLMFSDHDDVWMPDKISRTLCKYRETEADCEKDTPIMVFTDSVVTDRALNILSPVSVEAAEIQLNVNAKKMKKIAKIQR